MLSERGLPPLQTVGSRKTRASAPGPRPEEAALKGRVTGGRIWPPSQLCYRPALPSPTAGTCSPTPAGSWDWVLGRGPGICV